MDSIKVKLQPFVDKHWLAGAVTAVVSADRILDLQAFGFADIEASRPMTTDTTFWIASQTKTITSCLLMMLVEVGKLQLDDAVENYLPEFKEQWVIHDRTEDRIHLERPRRPMTIRDILCHCGGLPFSSPIERPTFDRLPLNVAVAAYALDPLESHPGSKYLYSNEGTNIAGRLVEVLSGMPYETFLDQRLLGPLKMVDTTFWPTENQLARLARSYKPDPAGTGLQSHLIEQLRYPLNDRARYPMPAGGLFSTASDLARLCQMFLNDGTSDGFRVLSKSSIKQMSTRQTDHSASESYGLGFFIRGDTFGHGGALSTNMTINPRLGLATIFLIQHSGFLGNGSGANEEFRNTAEEQFAGTAQR